MTTETNKPRYIEGTHTPTVTEAIAIGRALDARDMSMPWRDVEALLEALTMMVNIYDALAPVAIGRGARGIALAAIARAKGEQP